MWPFKKKKADAGQSMDWLPRAVDVAAKKWVEFESQPFAADWTLTEKLYRFSEGLGLGLRQWQGLDDLQDNLVFLIAAKGAEKSRTHLRIEIETAVGFPLPTPHERTDAEENRILSERMIDRARRKWIVFHQALQFPDDVSIQKRIEMFSIPFVQGVKADFTMFSEAPDDFFKQMIAVGIADSGTLSPSEIEAVLDMAS